MNEYLMILVMVLSVGLFALGGTGFKWARRFVLSAVLALIALLSHVVWWQCAGFALCLATALTLPYGERTPYPMKALVFSTYGLVFLWIGWSWWVVITPVLCFLLFIFSNLPLTARMFPWKICESGMGFLLGATFICSILNKWRV